MRRNASIELYRCLCMAGVVLLHALTQGGYADAHRGLDNLVAPSVVGFVFISGYCGIKCKLRSVLKLLGIGLSSFIMLVILSGNYRSSFGISGYWWFLWMYLALMAITPVVNAIFDENTPSRVLCKILPLLFVVFVWTYSATVIPVLKSIVPSANGFSPFSVLTFLGVYLVARTCKLYEEQLRTNWLLLAAATSGIFVWFGFYHYCSPFSLIFAGSIFFLIKRMPLPRFIEKTVMFFSHSMFAVYLLHTNTLGFVCLRKAENALITAGWDYYLMAFSVAIGIFVGGVGLDLPRRAALYCIKRNCKVAFLTGTCKRNIKISE